VKDIRRKDQREVETLGHLHRIRPKTEAAEHGIAARIADAQDDSPETLGPIHRFQDDAQHVVELEIFNQRVADILDPRHQDDFRIADVGNGFVLILDHRGFFRRRLSDRGEHGIRALLERCRRRFDKRLSLRRCHPGLDLPAEGRLFQVDADDSGKLGHLKKRFFHGFAQRLFAQRDVFAKPGFGLAQFFLPLFRIAHRDHRAQLIGEGRQDTGALLGGIGLAHIARRQLAHAVDDQTGEAPGARNADAQFLE